MKENRTNAMSSMPQLIKFPAENRSEFRAFWSERMNPDLEQRIGVDWRKKPCPGRLNRSLICRMALGNRFKRRGFLLHCVCFLPRLRSTLGHILFAGPFTMTGNLFSLSATSSLYQLI